MIAIIPKVSVAIKYIETDIIVPDFKKTLSILFLVIRRYVNKEKAASSDITINISAQTLIALNSTLIKKNATNVKTIIIEKIKISGRIFLII